MNTRAASSTPSSSSARIAAPDSASIERSSGILLSSASPVQEVKAVGMHSSAPFGFSRMNAGLVGSHAVYPRASKVARIPPVGNEEASGSPWISSLPENSAIAVPSPAGA